jgi:hypothetical protein
VLPVVALALHEALERSLLGESEAQIVEAVRLRKTELVAHPHEVLIRAPRRSPAQVGACVEQIVAVVRASPKPLTPEEIRRAVGASALSLVVPLEKARQWGRIVNVGGEYRWTRYVAAPTEGDVSAERALWHEAGSRRPIVVRSSDVVRAEAERIAVFLAKEGPLPLARVYAPLCIPYARAFGSVLHGLRTGLLTRGVDRAGRTAYASQGEKSAREVDRAVHPDGRPRRRTAEEIQADVDRLVALLSERGPLTKSEVRSALGWHSKTTFMTLRHGHRRGVVEQVRLDGRFVCRVRRVGPSLAKCAAKPHEVGSVAQSQEPR